MFLRQPPDRTGFIFDCIWNGLEACKVWGKADNEAVILIPLLQGSLDTQHNPEEMAMFPQKVLKISFQTVNISN